MLILYLLCHNKINLNNKKYFFLKQEEMLVHTKVESVSKAPAPVRSLDNSDEEDVTKIRISSPFTLDSEKVSDSY